MNYSEWQITLRDDFPHSYTRINDRVCKIASEASIEFNFVTP